MIRFLKKMPWLFLILIARNSLADTKFHYGDKVKFTTDFYGTCHGTVDSFNEQHKQYEVQLQSCNGHDMFRFVGVPESQLSLDK